MCWVLPFSIMAWKMNPKCQAAPISTSHFKLHVGTCHLSLHSVCEMRNAFLVCLCEVKILGCLNIGFAPLPCFHPCKSFIFRRFGHLILSMLIDDYPPPPQSPSGHVCVSVCVSGPPCRCGELWCLSRPRPAPLSRALLMVVSLVQPC